MARKLTAKQEAYKNLRVQGVTGPNAYRDTYNTKASPKIVSLEAAKLDKNPIIALELENIRKEATENALCSTEWIVKGLMKEAEGNGEDSTSSARVAAYKALTDFTGGFDNNKQKIDQTVTHKFSEMSDEELEEYIQTLST